MSWGLWVSSMAELPEQIEFERRDANRVRRLEYDDMQALSELVRGIWSNANVQATRIDVPCPRGPHPTNARSFRINLTNGYGGYGYCRCLHPSCAYKGPWHQIAEENGYGNVDADPNRPLRWAADEPPQEYKEHNFVLQPWPEYLVWDRDFLDHTGTVISAEAFIAFGAQHGTDAWGREYAVLHAYDYDGVTVAGDVAVLLGERVDRYGNALQKTMNSPGTWARSYVVGVHQMRDRFPDARSIVVTEGPSDALRLVEYGVPAVPSLGARTWSLDKSMMLSSFGFNRVFVCLNTDENGVGQQGAELAVPMLRQVGLDAISIAQPKSVDLCKMHDIELTDYINEHFR